MLREKPPINRRALLEAERRAKAVCTRLEAIVAQLEPGEVLGQPLRKGMKIVIPIVNPKKPSWAARHRAVFARKDKT